MADRSSVDQSFGGLVSRRAFLRTSGGLLTAATAGAMFGLPTAAGAGVARKRELSALVLSSDIYASPDPQRLAFALARGPKFVAGPPARVAFIPPDSKGEVTVEAHDTTLHTAGLPKGRGVYVVEATVPEPGAWGALVTTKGDRATFAFEVKEVPEAPVVGTAAPRVASPTKTDTLGVKPICTRRPRCPLHDVSLEALIGRGRPVAVMFATPALCASMYCGPVLDELLDVMEPYQDRVSFVHVEIYSSNKGVDLAPTVEAWNLPSEPWFFTVDGGGTIKGRIDGAFGGDEMTVLVA